MQSSLVIPVPDVSAVASARRAATQAAEALRLSETVTGRVALAATELATNLVKHSGGGDLIIESNDELPGTIDLLAIDKGKGIDNLNRALQDGFSTAGSSGTGLGALSRMASVFDVYSTGAGSVVLCRIEDPEKVARTSAVTSLLNGQLRVAGICMPYRGETESGDAWAALRSQGRMTVVVSDGLGHGEAAADASIRGIRAFKESNHQDPVEILRAMHDALRSTRGAAVAVTRLYLDRGVAEYVGIGNISGTIVDDRSSRKMVSLAGIVGHEMRKVQAFTYPWTASSLLLMHSDGLSANWALSSYPGIEQHDAAVVAAVLFRDHCRRTDDSTVVVVKP